MKNGLKSIRLNSIQSEESIQMIRNRFQTRFSIRIKPNYSDLRFIRINSDWKFGLDQSELGLIQIISDWKLGSDSFELNQIKSDLFLAVFINRDIKHFSEWFGMVRKQIPEWLGTTLIRSEWILIRYLRQGNILYYRNYEFMKKARHENLYLNIFEWNWNIEK